MNLSKSISSQTVLLILSGIIVILLITLTVFQVIKLNELNVALPEMRTAVQNNESRLATLKQLEVIKPLMLKTYDYLNKKIPKEPMEHQIIDQLYGISLDQNTDLLEIYFDERQQTENSVEKMPMQISFSGSYKSFIKVLEAINDGERLITIQHVLISKPESSLGQIKADISAAAFSGQ